MRDADARAFLAVHHAAVRVLAAPDYPESVIDAWAPLPITDSAVATVTANPEREYRLLAALDGIIAGIGVLVLEKSELRACYVAPWAARRGVGTALVKELERVARAHGLGYLCLDSSLNAAPFYRGLGYLSLGPGEHVLSNGQRMRCVRMRRSSGLAGR